MGLVATPSGRILGRVLRGSVELPLAGVHFFPMRTNMCPARQDTALSVNVKC
jgi:hypothetical protein